MTGDPLDNFEKQMQTCVEYLAKSDAKDSLRPLLVRLLLVSAHGAYEKAIRDAVCRRAKKSSDGKFVRYLGEVTQRHNAPFDGLSIKSLMTAYGRPRLGLAIRKEVNDAYKRLSNSRHIVAHGGDVDMTLEDMQEMHNKAKKVPHAFVDALCDMQDRPGT